MICTGIDLGGTQIKLARHQADGACVVRASVPTADAADFSAPRFVESIRDLLREHAEPGERVGVSAPGLASVDGDAIASMPGRLGGVRGAELERSPPPPRDGS